MIEKNISFSLGDIVKATKGRDANRLFAIIAILENDYYLIANGSSRSLVSPKRKKAKHLVGIGRRLSDAAIAKIGTDLTDRALKGEISSVIQE